MTKRARIAKRSPQRNFQLIAASRVSDEDSGWAATMKLRFDEVNEMNF
jgi:hypothetical protein